MGLQQSIIQAPPLQEGDQVGIISTARKIDLATLEPAIKLLEGWGLNVVLGTHLFKEDNQFAGTIKERSKDLQCMIDNPNIKGIICARGGYGSIQVIDLVDFSTLQRQPKWIAGYSDVTVLHSHLHQLGIASLHSSMPVNFSKNTAKSLESLQQALFGEELHYTIPTQSYNRKGSAQGIVVGGNLSILYSLMASPSDINTDGKILFLEDLDEYLYHLDRMLMNLKRSGKLKHLAGLVVGGMSDMNDNAIPFGKTAKEIIQSAVSEYSYPVCFDFPAGHLEDNRCIPLGLQAKLIVDKTVSLSYGATQSVR